MWQRRGSTRLLHALLRNASQQVEVATAVQNGQSLPSVTSLTAARSFGSSFWDVPAQSRQDLFIELHTIRSMLPDRSPFIPHFTPHGVMLMPNSSSKQLAAVGPVQQQAVDDEASAEEGMWADSVKRKRKLKMKRHKLKKRRKLTRHQP
jgi:hypothetical protein